LNLTKDLSPSINTLAIDSLNSEELRIFDSSLRAVLKSLTFRGWFKAFEEDIKTYNQLRRKLSLDYYSSCFPSTDHLLGLYASDMAKHLYRPYADIDR